MGNARGSSLPAVPSSDRLCHCWKVLQNHEQVGMATTGLTEADRRWSFADESLESESRNAHAPLFKQMLLMLTENFRFITATDST